MKLTKSKLKQFIREKIVQTMKEGDVVQGPWPPGTDEGDKLPAEFQYEYVLDELVNAARDSVMPLAVKKLKDVGAFSDEEERGRGLTYNDVELEIEEGLLDALTPLAKMIQNKIDYKSGAYLTEVKIGDRVEHREYGQGQVSALRSGKGGDRRVVVNWDRKGENRETIVDSLKVIKEDTKPFLNEKDSHSGQSCEEAHSDVSHEEWEKKQHNEDNL